MHANAGQAPFFAFSTSQPGKGSVQQPVSSQQHQDVTVSALTSQFGQFSLAGATTGPNIAVNAAAAINGGSKW